MRSSQPRRLAPILTLLVLVFVLAPARASHAQAGVQPPSQAQVRAAKSVFRRGLVILVDRNQAGRLRQATLFGRINAPHEAIYDILADPNNLPRMQPAMSNIKIKGRRDNAVTYSWTYGDAITRMNGVFAMALAPPHAIHARSIGGFGPGVLLYRLHPDGPDRTIVTLSMHVNVTKSSNVILRFLTNNEPGFLEAWNLGYSIICYRGLEQLAVKQAGGSVPPPTGKAGIGPLRPFTTKQAKRLMPLLRRGSVAIIETDRQGRVAQSSLAEYVKAPTSAIEKLVRRPQNWGKAFGHIDFDNFSKTAAGDDFRMNYRFVAFTISTNFTMAYRPDGADINSPSGDLYRSLFAFNYAAEGEGSLLTVTGRVRFRHNSRILRRMIDEDPYFGHALNASSVSSFSRGFKRGAER